jgi:acetyl-CoA acetyltransferase family protein
VRGWCGAACEALLAVWVEVAFWKTGYRGEIALKLESVMILSAVRTPVGRSQHGSLASVDAYSLGEHVVQSAIDQAGVAPNVIEELIFGESLQGGGDIARNVAVRLGMAGTPGVAVNRHCASGLTAIAFGAAAIAMGMADVVMVGGTESLSTMPSLAKGCESDGSPSAWFPETHPSVPSAPAYDVGITVGENTARLAGLSRQEIDSWAHESHRRAAAAIDAGVFDSEIAPIDIEGADGHVSRFAVDETVRRNLDLDAFARMPVLYPHLPDATVTALNASGISDAAAALVLASDRFAKVNGLSPLACVTGWAHVADIPARTGLAPALAIPRALGSSGLDLRDVDVVEINEAFCSVALANTRALDLDPSRVNVNGSGCSLGHPVACTGARMAVSMVHELRRADLQHGLVSMCAGGGMAAAMTLSAA